MCVCVYKEIKGLGKFCVCVWNEDQSSKSGSFWEGGATREAAGNSQEQEHSAVHDIPASSARGESPLNNRMLQSSSGRRGGREFYLNPVKYTSNIILKHTYAIL